MSDRDEAQRQAFRVLHRQDRGLNAARQTAKATRLTADAAIGSSEELLRSLGRRPLKPVSAPRALKPPPSLRPWGEILAEAESSVPGDADFHGLLSQEEIRRVLDRHQTLEDEFDRTHQLDGWDYAIAGTAGVLAALIDIFLVQVPKHPNYLGGKGRAAGGWLSNVVKEKFGDVLPPDTIRALERDYPVCFDRSTSNGLGVPVEGLYPGSHRFQSPGHDPFLGWIVGVRDVLEGQFTAFGRDGRLIVQAIPGAGAEAAGVDFLVRLFGAFRQVAGHLVSDVATSAGLPAPLMPLLSFLQFGTIGEHGHTIANVARLMYREGYDFRHFVAGSLPVMLIEFIVRACYMVRRLHEGASLADSIPFGNDPRLRTQLFLAHTVAAAANAGKVAVTKNPLGVSWAQWLAFFRYLLPQAHWVLIGREEARAAHVEAHIDRQWGVLGARVDVTWSACFAQREYAQL